MGVGQNVGGAPEPVLPPRRFPSRGHSASLTNIGLDRQLQIAGEVDEASLRQELQNEQLFNKFTNFNQFAKDPQLPKPKMSQRAFSETEIRDLRVKTPDLINGNVADNNGTPLPWQGRKFAAKPQFLYYL